MLICAPGAETPPPTLGGNAAHLAVLLALHLVALILRAKLERTRFSPPKLGAGAIAWGQSTKVGGRRYRLGAQYKSWGGEECRGRTLASLPPKGFLSPKVGGGVERRGRGRASLPILRVSKTWPNAHGTEGRFRLCGQHRFAFPLHIPLHPHFFAYFAYFAVLIPRI